MPRVSSQHCISLSEIALQYVKSWACSSQRWRWRNKRLYLVPHPIFKTTLRPLTRKHAFDNTLQTVASIPYVGPKHTVTSSSEWNILQEFCACARPPHVVAKGRTTFGARGGSCVTSRASSATQISREGGRMGIEAYLSDANGSSSFRLLASFKWLFFFCI